MSDKVFVVHGRNEGLRRSMFGFLRALGLKPLEWNEAVRLTANASPYIGQVLDSAMAEAKAIVVLFSGDDYARLASHLKMGSDDPFEDELTPQARPNVLFEAGMAFGRFPDRTILVQIGKLRPFSDIGGRHMVFLDDSSERRNELAQRLKGTGCVIETSGNDWQSVGEFREDRGNMDERPIKTVEGNSFELSDRSELIKTLKNLRNDEDYMLNVEIANVKFSRRAELIVACFVAAGWSAAQNRVSYESDPRVARTKGYVEGVEIIGANVNLVESVVLAFRKVGIGYARAVKRPVELRPDNPKMPLINRQLTIVIGHPPDSSK